MPILSLENIEQNVFNTLKKAGANDKMASSTAKALVLAEAQGIPSHGLSRVSQYCSHLNNGRVDGKAQAQITISKNAATQIDAKTGLAFPACELAITEAINKANEFGISISSVINSHHAGVLVDHLRPLSNTSLVGLAFSNVPAVMPVAGGKHAILGTNPIAALFPRQNNTPLMIDLSLSEVARGKLVMAKNAEQKIPLGWALDSNGEPTTDPREAMDGLMLPIGSSTSTKGAMLALIVELLASAVIGANFGFEASTFFTDEGNIPKIGQTFIIINPNFLSTSNSYFQRIELLVNEMLKDEGVRLPGVRRENLLKKAIESGIEVSDSILKTFSVITH